MGRRLPFRAQVEVADCGAACLGIVLEHHGRHVPLEDLRALTNRGRDGTDAFTLAETARTYGLRARGVKADVDDLGGLPQGSILFWDMSHFVVLDRVTRSHLEIVDPAVGHRRIPWDDVRGSYTGIAVVLEPGDEFTRGGTRAKPGSIWRHVRPLLRQGAALRRVSLVSLVLRLLGLGLPLLTAALVDRVVPTGDRGLLEVVAVCLVAVVGFNFFSSWVRSRILLEMRTVIDVGTTLGFLEHLVALPFTYHLRRSAGDMMMRLRSNTVVREVLTTASLSALLDGAFVTIYLALLVALAPDLALVVLGIAAAQIVVLALSRNPTQRLATEGLQAEARTQSYALQLLSGMGTLKASGTERRAVEQFTNFFVEEQGVVLARGRLTALVDSLMGALQLAAPLMVLTVAGMRVLDGTMSLGTALAVNALAAGFLGPLSTLVTTGLSMLSLRSYLERLNDVLDTAVEQEGDDVRPADVLRGGISAEDLWFQYGPQSPMVVRGVSLEVRPGCTIALVGRSGSGKTTIAHLLIGLYAPVEGTVRFDGVDLRSMELGSVRRQFGVVTQEPYLFGLSIRANIAFADPALSLEEIEAAARIAGIHDDIVAMPMGYDTVLGDGGGSISGGQRQRIALARAIASKPKVLLLDEATSHLDAITEARVYEHLESLDCTKIIVAHRLSTIAGADTIVVVDQGQVVEMGSHRELLARRGAYHELVNGQLDTPDVDLTPVLVGGGGSNGHGDAGTRRRPRTGRGLRALLRWS